MIRYDLELFGEVYERFPLKKLSSIKIGGEADFVVVPDTLDHLMECISFLNEKNETYKIIGNASNILFSDLPYHGVIVRLSKALNAIQFNQDFVYAEASVSLIKLAHQSVLKGFGDLEFASGIPGSLGGALFMNAGAYQKSMYDVVNRVLIYENKELKWLNREDIKIDYRYSSFMDSPNILICAAELALNPCNIEEAQAIIKDRLQRRLASQPLEYPSCGSVFRNPFPDLSWQLIESVGLRGHQIGGAQISLKHANFIVNIDHAKASDVKSLIELIEKEVYEKHKIHLKKEVEFFNFYE